MGAETPIRLMSRLANECDGIDLVRGYATEAPPRAALRRAVAALLGGAEETAMPDNAVALEDMLARQDKEPDWTNQYTLPHGLPRLRQAVAEYAQASICFRPGNTHAKWSQ